MITKITHLFQWTTPQAPPARNVVSLPQPSQKNWLEETKGLTWTSVINLETLSLGAISCCFDFSPEQIILLLLSMKVSALMIPVLIPTLAPEVFLIGAAAILAALMLMLLATMVYKGYQGANKRAAAETAAKAAAEAAAKRAAEEAARKAQQSSWNPLTWLASIGAIFIALT